MDDAEGIPIEDLKAAVPRAVALVTALGSFDIDNGDAANALLAAMFDEGASIDDLAALTMALAQLVLGLAEIVGDAKGLTRAAVLASLGELGLMINEPPTGQL